MLTNLLSAALGLLELFNRLLEMYEEYKIKRQAEAELAAALAEADKKSKEKADENTKEVLALLDPTDTDWMRPHERND